MIDELPVNFKLFRSDALHLQRAWKKKTRKKIPREKELRGGYEKETR